MKHSLSLLLCLTLCFTVPPAIATNYHVPKPFQPVNHGVGFGLSLDYGTCSVYFANGSTVDVAKIEGNHHYKHAMRQIEATNETYFPSKPLPRDGFLSRLHDVLPLPSLLRNALGIEHHCSPDAAVIASMLKTLRTAASTYLSHPVPVADLVIPMPISPTGEAVLESACSSINLRRAAAFPVAGSLVATANGIGAYYQNPDSCWGEGARSQLVLTVDFGRAALTAIVYWEEMCVFEVMRVRHEVELGADALDKCRLVTIDDGKDCFTDLEEALREIVKLPIEDEAERGVPGMIDSVVLLGEKGTDPRLTELLQQVLAKQNIRVALPGSKYKGEIGVVDPAFAAARGVAAASWGVQNEHGGCLI